MGKYYDYLQIILGNMRIQKSMNGKEQNQI